MQHPAYLDELQCGEICASKMAGNYVGIKQNEKKMRSTAGKRARFAKRKGWRVSSTGTPNIEIDGYHIVVTKRGKLFGLGVKVSGTNSYHWGENKYPSAEAAKTGAFDAWEVAKEKWPGGRR